MAFRDRLVATLRAMAPVLAEPGVLVAGSQVPNLLEAGQAATLVVTQDVDLAIPVDRLEGVKAKLRTVAGYAPSTDEPSIWLPRSSDALEVNFIGFEPGSGPGARTYVLDDPVLPLLVFGTLAGLRPGRSVRIDDLEVPLPRIADLLAEKLMTDRSGEKGERDLLVALGLLVVAGEPAIVDLERAFGELDDEQRHAVLSNLTVLSLLRPHRQMPDPERHRQLVARVAARLAAASR